MAQQPFHIAVEPAQVGLRTAPTVSLHDIWRWLKVSETFAYWRDHTLSPLVIRRDLDYAPGRAIVHNGQSSHDLRLTLPAARTVLTAVRGSRATMLNRDLASYEQELAKQAAGGVASADILPVGTRALSIGQVVNDLPNEFSVISSLCVAQMVEIGGRSVIGIEDARSLHTFLKVGRDYTNWIKDRIDRLGFVEGQDFQVTEGLSSPNLASAKSRPQITKLYALTLDMAKHLAMAENNDVGRLVRRYFIWVEEHARVPAPAPVLAGPTLADFRAMLADALPRLVAAEMARDPRVAVVEFKAPIQLLRELNVPQRGRRPLSRRVSHRLFKYAIATGRGTAIRESAETGRHLFQVDVVKDWLDAEVSRLIADHKAKVLGQGVIPFAPKPL